LRRWLVVGVDFRRAPGAVEYSDELRCGLRGLVDSAMTVRMSYRGRGRARTDAVACTPSVRRMYMSLVHTGAPFISSIS
jgi:hypothetical protein